MLFEIGSKLNYDLALANTIWVSYNKKALNRPSPPYNQKFVNARENGLNIDKTLIPSIPPSPKAKGPPHFKNYSLGAL